MIHIVHIIPSLRFGGAERMVVSLMNHSDPERFRHSVITLCEDLPLRDQIIAENVDVRIIPKKGKMSLHLFSDLEDVLRDMRPDIVNTHLSGGDIWGRVAAHRLRIPVVSTQHNMTRDLGWVKNSVMRHLRTYADLYVACSISIKKDVTRTHLIPARMIQVIHNGIELQRFVSIPAAAWNRPTQFLIIGRLTAQKGQDIALHALAKIKETSWHLTIVGEGQRGPAFASLAHRLGIADRVTFVQPTPDVSSFFLHSDIVLMPSRYEGLGVVAMEAMAAGRTIIASAVDGLKEIMTHEKTGLLVLPENTEILAHQITWALEHKQECLNIGQRAREYAKENFGMEKMVREYERVYSSIV